MNFKSSFLVGLALIFSVTLFSKNIYIKYDPACMDRLEYRLNGNMAGNGLISYSLRANDKERVVMEIGVESIKKIKRMPRGTKTCGKVKVNDLLANSINSGKDKVYIVRKVGQYYLVSPVHLATYMRDGGNNFSMRGNELDMSYATSDIGVMENNLADNNSSTKVYFIGSEKQACSDAYMLKKIPIETCKPYTDMTFLPGIGIIEEKTGLNQAEAEGNILRLVKINGVPLAEYMDNKCNDGAAELAVKYEPAPAPTRKPATTTRAAAPAPPQQPASYEVVFEVDNTPPAPEYTPAGSEVIYQHDEPQQPLETFRPKGVDCNKLNYPGVHIVQASQTLYGIARRYGVTVNQLRAWNKIGEKGLIKPCENLYVLPPESVAANTTATDGPLPTAYSASDDQLTPKGSAEILYPNTDVPTPTTKQAISKPKDGCNLLAYDGVHIVQKGETLYSIAKQHGLTVKQVKAWNKLGKEDKIKPCTSLYIKTPEAVIAAVNAANQPANAAPAKGENYTIPDTELGPSYTNSAADPQILANTNPNTAPTPNKNADVFVNGQSAPATNVSKGAANVAATDKMWNSGIEYHVVQKGETLTALAKMYGFTLERFRDINGLGDSNIIRIGQVLRTGNCLCPANGAGPTNTRANNGTATTNVSNSTPPASSTVQKTPDMTAKGGNTSERTVERSTQYEPVPTPYDYETEAILNNSKRSNGTVSYRNGRKVHTVQENETMASIANQYNIPIDLLRKLNKMEKNEIVIPDMKIYLE